MSSRISEKDIKLLWGRAANRCSMPNCNRKLSANSSVTSASVVLGEMAHIVGEEDAAPRGKSLLTREERNSYHNLILLCGDCHSRIDKMVDDFPVEKLHEIKSKHELWVFECLVPEPNRKKEAADLVYSALTQSAVEDCLLDKWSAWISGIAGVFPQCKATVLDHIPEYSVRIATAVWPAENLELERALQLVATTTRSLIDVFLQHSFPDDRQPHIIKMIPGFHDRFTDQYNEWIQLLDILVRDATSAANWLGSVVRRDINPLFFAVQGKFSFCHDSVEPHGEPMIYFPEFGEAERRTLLTSPLESTRKAKEYLELYHLLV